MPSANFLEFLDIISEERLQTWKTARKAFISQVDRYESNLKALRFKVKKQKPKKLYM